MISPFSRFNTAHQLWQLHLVQRLVAKKGCNLLSLRSEAGSVVEVGLSVLVWIVLLCTLSLDVVLIIHPLGARMSTLLSLVGVVLVHALGLGAENYQYV